MSLYPPPEMINAEVFSRLPDEFRRPGVDNEWSRFNRTGVDSFLEGPSFDKQGNLYVVDIPFGRIFKISPQGEFSLICEYDGWPNGLKIHEDGRIFIADYKNGIMLLNPETGDIRPVLKGINSESFKGCNDLHFGADGALYFTDQGQTGLHDASGRVYRWQAETDQLDCLISCGVSPNGLVLDIEEKNLYVAMTRANAIWRVPLGKAGLTSKVGLYIQLSGGRSGPDGLSLDEAGRLFVCHAGLGTVWVFDELGRPVYGIRAPKGLGTTNCAFGDKNNQTLFITESDTGSILRVDMDIPGKQMFSRAMGQ
ncbi:MAG: SMP-30/gluconolactonase/LRE family protein [Desulfuromonadales bacterium]|nr:SMP-30/gluconolactonase/LRE family protein [Desulfuromonadales bacterium]MBN2792023.1 SMP-30/gluconolactonase/LRE family protein [Desulfuromonadales bacterium]